MRKTFARLSLMAFALLMSAAFIRAHAAGTPAQAKALAEKAVTLVRSDGSKAFATINSPSGGFVNGDLYVGVVDQKGVIRANGAFPQLVGVNMWNERDPDGLLVIQKMLKTADSNGSGWIMIKFTDPATKKIEPKKTWVQKVGNYVVFCGAYVNG